MSSNTKEDQRSAPPDGGEVHPEWTAGDFSLVSKDGIIFKVQSYHLQSSSDVLRDMIAAGHGPKQVQLDARAATIRHFLQIVREGSATFDETENYGYVYQVVDLVRFLDKYECNAALNVFLKDLDGEKVPPIVNFAVGAVLGQPERCSAALDTYKSRFWSSYPIWQVIDFPKADRDKLLKVDMFLPHLIPRRLFFSFPPEYAWALVVTVSAKEHEFYRGNRFLELMEAGQSDTEEG